MGPAAVNAAPQPARRRLLVEVVEGVPLDEIVNPLLDEWW
jgi:ribosomal protein L12E/L44/L45/RPP1/RPP2